MNKVITHATGVRKYFKNGSFAQDFCMKHAGIKAAVEDAGFALSLASDPNNQDEYEVEHLIKTMPTNIYVRDLSTGRFVKWRDV